MKHDSDSHGDGIYSYITLDTAQAMFVELSQVAFRDTDECLRITKEKKKK